MGERGNILATYRMDVAVYGVSHHHTDRVSIPATSEPSATHATACAYGDCGMFTHTEQLQMTEYPTVHHT